MMAKKAKRKAGALTSAGRRAKAAKGKVKAKAKPKPEKQRAKADAKAAHGGLPQWTHAEIEEAFRRFQACLFAYQQAQHRPIQP